MRSMIAGLALLAAAAAIPIFSVCPDAHADADHLSRASADTPRVGFVHLGQCVDKAWQTEHWRGLPLCETATRSDEIEALRGAKVHATLPRKGAEPHFGEEVGRVRVGQRVKLLRIYVLSADPGSPRAVWGEVSLSASSTSTPTAGERAASPTITDDARYAVKWSTILNC